MKYMGSKNRYAKELLPIILKNRKEGQWYVEPFVGGANMIDKVDGNRIGADSNEYLVSMWQAIQRGWTPPHISKKLYNIIKNNKHKYAHCLVGWAGVALSYSGKWFGGFAGKVDTKQGVRDYQKEAQLNLYNQRGNITGIEFMHKSYLELELPTNSLIYCDPPYANTTKYKDDFNHDEFWQWCRGKVNEGHQMFISEYNAPEDFICVWEKQSSSSLSANGSGGGNKKATEKLFIHKTQAHLV